MHWGREGRSGDASARVRLAARRLAGHEVLQAVVIIAVGALVLVWQPIVSGGYLAPADHSQSMPILRSDPDHRVANAAMVDVAVDIVPWLAWDAAEVRERRLPTWNPLNGSGVPHLANGQSAVFSPFTVPFYVLSFRAALVVSAFAELMVAGLLAYGLARHLRLSHLAGLVCGLGFAFSAYMVLWLRWPMATAGAYVPGIVWAADAVVVAATPRARRLAAAGLAVCFGLSLLAGHPETTFFGGAIGAVTGLARLVHRHTGRRDIGRRAAVLAGAFVLGLGLAAVQVLPLLEYIGESPAGENRDGHQVFFDGGHAALQAFPFVLGSPVHEFSGATHALGMPYLGTASTYVGLGVLFLAGVGAMSPLWTGRRAPVLFAGLALLWLPYGYDIAGIGTALSSLPLFELILAIRSNVLWTLCLTVAAAFGVDALRTAAETRSRVVPVATALWGAALLLIAWLLQRSFRSNARIPDRDAVADLAARTAHDHLVYVIATFALVVAGSVLLASGRPARWLRAGGLLIATGVLLQSSVLLRDVNPTVRTEHLYARTAAFDQVTEITGTEQTLRLDRTALFPDINLWFGVSSPSTYDAIGVRDYDTLYRQLLRTPPVDVDGGVLGILHLPVDPVGIGGLRLLGIRYVTSGLDYPFGDEVGRAADPSIGADGSLRFELDQSGPIDTITARLPTLTTETDCRLDIRTPGDRGPVIASSEARCGPAGAAFPVEVRDHDEGTRLSVTVTPLPAPDLASAARTGLVEPHPGAHSDDDATGSERATVTAYATAVTGLEPVAEVAGRFRVFRVPGGPARYFSPATTVAGRLGDGADGDAVIDDVRADPLRRSVIDAGDDAVASDGTAPGRVEVLSETSTAMRVRVTRETAGWLVVQQTRYPGWGALVDGRPVDVATANGAFLAVPVPAGTSEVALRFEPTSVRLGAALSFLSVAVILGLLVAARATRRGNRESAASTSPHRADDGRRDRLDGQDGGVDGGDDADTVATPTGSTRPQRAP